MAQRNKPVQEDEDLLNLIAPTRKARRNSSTRASKIAAGEAPTPKKNEVKRVSAKLEAFVPTASQRTFINKIISNTVTFCDSPAGTGKTSSALYHFCKEYLRDPSLQIYITRTPTEVGKDKIGFLPNSAQEKCEPHFSSTKIILENFLGKEKFAADIGKRIHFTIPNYILGTTLDNACSKTSFELSALPSVCPGMPVSLPCL